MKSLRTASCCASALVLVLSLFAPLPAAAQQPRLTRVGTGYLLLTAANTYQVVRVTIGTVEQNDRFVDVFARAIAGGPQLPAPPDTGGAMTRVVGLDASGAAAPVGG